MFSDEEVANIVVTTLGRMMPNVIDRIDRGIARPGDIGIVQEMTALVRCVETQVRAAPTTTHAPSP